MSTADQLELGPGQHFISAVALDRDRLHETTYVVSPESPQRSGTTRATEFVIGRFLPSANEGSSHMPYEALASNVAHTQPGEVSSLPTRYSGLYKFDGREGSQVLTSQIGTSRVVARLGEDGGITSAVVFQPGANRKPEKLSVQSALAPRILQRAGR